MTTETATVAVEEALNLHSLLSIILHLDGRAIALSPLVVAGPLVSKSLFNLQF
jgi:hypothetical protein